METKKKANSFVPESCAMGGRLVEGHSLSATPQTKEADVFQNIILAVGIKIAENFS